MKLEHFIIPYTKINSKWIKDLNIGLNAVKLLEENIGRTLFDINCNDVILDPPSRVMKLKANRKRWYLVKLKEILHSQWNHKQNEKMTHRVG